MGKLREEIAKNLLYYRKKFGMTQKELADKLGVKQTSVSNWEKGYNSIDIETLFVACDIFGVTLNDMYGNYGDTKMSDDVSSKLTDRELAFVKVFNELTDDQQDLIIAAMKGIIANYDKSEG